MIFLQSGCLLDTSRDPSMAARALARMANSGCRGISSSERKPWTAATCRRFGAVRSIHDVSNLQSESACDPVAKAPQRESGDESPHSTAQA